MLRSKIHVVSSTIFKVLLILVPNRSCVQKSHGLIWSILEISSLKKFEIADVGKYGGIEILMNVDVGEGVLKIHQKVLA